MPSVDRALVAGTAYQAGAEFCSSSASSIKGNNNTTTKYILNLFIRIYTFRDELE